MGIHIITKEIFFGSPEYFDELELRNEVLRKPLGMNLYDQDLSAEKEYIRESFRGFDIGSKIIQFAEDLISSRGFSKIILNARKVALPFYLKSGYVIQGDEFEEVGIPHFKMSKIVK